LNINDLVALDTEIDWSTYMQQVSMVFDKGVRDYSQISGDSGPLVYPAGFVYLFRALQMVCGEDIRRGQIVFAVIYMAQLILTFWMYRKSGIVRLLNNVFHTIVACRKALCLMFCCY
jgi:alpha-1,3-mannosyltransferase